MGENHPSLDITGSHGSELAGRRIVLCVTGSVAAYRAVELARLLMRRGADVSCVTSPASAGLISPEYLKWATGNEVVTKLTGDLEHIRLADYGRSDAILVYPATANTLGKLACGIDDTPVSTVLTVGLGAGIPVIACPAMHEAMYGNAAVRRNIDFLKGWISFVPPNVAEGKAKVAEPADVVNFVIGRIGRAGELAGRSVLLTAGPTVEHVDAVRVITNISTGRTGILLARELLLAGADVTMIYGPGSETPPEGVRVVPVVSAQDMAAALKAGLEGGPDIVIMAAAAADYTPEERNGGKLDSSADKIRISLKRVPKMIRMVKRIRKDAFLVGFKAEANVSAEELVERAREKISETGADLVIANDVGSSRYREDPGSNEVMLVDARTSASSGWRPKEEIARVIVREIGRRVTAGKEE